MRIARLESPLVFDGKLDEAFWDGFTPLPLFTHGPTFGDPPTERSDIYMAYDDNYFYCAGRFFVSRPEDIRGTTFKRDAFDASTDFFGIIIDSYNDKENALAFYTNPVAMRWDAAIFNDAQGELPLNIDWNGFWEVKTWQSQEAWHAEIRIPLSTLRFQDRDGRVVMGVSASRYISAKVENDIFPNIPPNWGQWSNWKPSQLTEITLEGVHSRKPFYIAPYLLGGLQESARLDKGGQAYHAERTPKVELGGDVKIGLTNNLTLDLTANTDFAQVEADDEQVNLTRFSLFFPEKRQFFLERSSVFDFTFDEFNRLFYSRRIGLKEDEPVRIYGGARLIGRVGNHDLGFLNMQTAPADSTHGENFMVLRTRHRLLNANSYLGSMLANRMDFKGGYNTAAGFDGLLRLFGDEYLNVKWAGTFHPGAANRLLSLDPARLYLDWERRRYDGFSYRLTFSRAGKDYEPATGFELREDYHSVNTQLQYGWIMGDRSPLVRLQAYLKGQAVRRNAGGVLETGILNGGFLFETKNAWFGDFHLILDREDVSDAFDLTDEVSVPAGRYGFMQAEGFFQTPFNRMVNAMVNYTFGGFYGGAIYSLGITPVCKLSAHLELSGFYQFNHLSFRERNLGTNTHLGRIKVQYLFNTRVSAAAFLQYNSQEKVFVTNFRVRFNPREGNDLFLVFNDLLNSRRDRELPHLPLHEDRAVVLKYTYTLTL